MEMGDWNLIMFCLSYVKMIMEMVDERDESEVQITRSLLLDFSEKSDESNCSSVCTYQALLNKKEKLTSDDDDAASIWSIQVNASSTRDDEEEEEDFDESSAEEDDEYYYDEGGENVDDLCEEMSKIFVEEPKFMGKHIRFVYNSEDEIEEEEVLGVVRLKGLPTPKGKHLRFLEG